MSPLIASVLSALLNLLWVWGSFSCASTDRQLRQEGKDTTSGQAVTFVVFMSLLVVSAITNVVLGIVFARLGMWLWVGGSILAFIAIPAIRQFIVINSTVSKR
jgi:hypothetical protein